MKTLGLIANEAFDSVDGRLFSESWEAAAHAVRLATIKEAIDALHQADNGKGAETIFWHFSHGDEEYLQE